MLVLGLGLALTQLTTTWPYWSRPSMFHSGARAYFITGGIGCWVGPSTIPSKAWHYARTLKHWVSACWTHSCVRVLLIVAAIKACIAYVYGDLQLTSLRYCEPTGFAELRRRGEGYRLNDLRPRLCCRPKECRYTVQHGMRQASAAVPSRQPLLRGSLRAKSAKPCIQTTSPPPHRWTVGPAPQLQPNITLAESSTPWHGTLEFNVPLDSV